MPFTEDSHVDVRQVDDENWELLRAVRYVGSRDCYPVPAASPTDFASVPRPLVWFLPRYGRYTRAAVLHDFLWRVAVPANALTLADADGIFRRSMRELGVPFLRRWLMWAAVRIGALRKPGGRERWIRDSLAVFPLAILALPFLAPPAILIGVALLGFTLVEFLFYLPLLVDAELKRRRAETPKRVNAPQFEWNLS